MCTTIYVLSKNKKKCHIFHRKVIILIYFKKFCIIHKHDCEMISSKHEDENSEQISEWSLRFHNTIDAYRTEKTRLNWSNLLIGINVFLSYEGLASSFLYV